MKLQLNTDVIKVRIYTAILLACLSIPFSASALKTDGTSQTCVTGRVVDEKNEGIPGASVSVKYGMYRDEVLGYTACDDDGGFRLSGIPPGDYCLIISSIGYETRIDNISITPDSTLTLGELQLKPDATELQTVVVEGRPIDVRMNPDGYTMDVSRLALFTNDIFDLLGRLPRITAIGKELKVAGKNRVLVKINNVLQQVSGDQLAEVLKSFDSALAQSVEVIMNPPLKYDPDGDVAMIVVHMNSFFDQYMGGMVTLQGSKAARSGFSWGGAASLIMNYKKLYLQATPAYGDYLLTSQENTHGEFNNGTVRNLPSSNKVRVKTPGANVQVQYQFKEKSHIGGNISYNYTHRRTRSTGIDEYTPLNADIPNTFTYTNVLYKPQRLTATAYLEHALSDNATMWLDAFYTYSYNGDQSFRFRSFDQEDGVDYTNYLRSDDMIANLTGLTNDYSIKLGSEGRYRIETGFSAHYSHTRQSNGTEWFAPVQEPQSDLMKYDEVKVSPYFTTALGFSHGLRLRLGLRVPVTTRYLKIKDGTKDDKNYVNWLPRMSFVWQPSFIHQFSVRVNSYATQPSFSYLNPVEESIDNNTILCGNPDLKSLYSYSYLLEYTYMGVLSFDASITQTFGDIAQIKIYDEATGTFVYRPENAQNSVKYGAHASYYYNKLWWMLIQARANVGYEVSKSKISGIPARASGVDWGVSGWINFYFEKERKFSLNIYGQYNGKTVSAYNVVDPSWNLGMTFSANLLNHRLSLYLTGSLASRYKAYEKTDNYIHYYNTRSQYPTIGIGISYRFNNVDEKQIRRTLSSEESIRRL